jgi:elongation of very long chain fatty acids protein 4
MCDLVFLNMDQIQLARQAAIELGDQLIAWANPTLGVPATKGWPLTSVDDMLLVLIAYLSFVALGSFVMRLIYGSEETSDNESAKVTVAEKFKREPILVIQAVYNLAQVVLCAYMIVEAVREALKKEYTFVCNAFNPQESGMARVLWIFYLSKVFDFFDTVFIIARRKWRQLIFLHVYHHASIFAVRPLLIVFDIIIFSALLLY